MAEEKETKGAAELLRENDLQQIIDILASVQHGSVTLIIQNGKVVQIEKHEKIRLV
ncbi:MAG: YezD family protein [Treponema sp.]|jgi:hypothetical protein|nr:YezD family protein [Treponema sp.]